MPKPMQKNIDGILLLDKPINITSNGALQRVKRLFSAKKAGHTGSLDPLATGMLPLCFGEATKFSQFLLESNKYYQVTVKLGEQTTTGDAEGSVIATKAIPVLTQESIEKVLRQFEGEIQQIPPMFSAIKYQGKPLYELARKGIEIERQPRSVYIHHLRLEEFTENTLSLNIFCSKGTYVRTLAEDISERLNCLGHVSRLRRPVVVPYEGVKMYPLAELEEIHAQFGTEGLAQLLLPVESAVKSFPAIKLSTSAVFYLRMGQAVMVPHLPQQGFVRLYADDAQFMGVGEIMDDGRVAPRRLVSQLKKMAKAV